MPGSPTPQPATEKFIRPHIVELPQTAKETVLLNYIGLNLMAVGHRPGSDVRHLCPMGMNCQSLRLPKYRAGIELSAPTRKAVALVGKSRGFRSVLRPKIHRYIGFGCKIDYLGLNVFIQTSSNAATKGRPTIQMPIAQRPS